MDDDVRPTRQQISDAVDAAGWRLILGAIHAEAPTRSLLEGSEAASLAVSAVGADGQGHLTVDIRADRTVLRLHSADVGAVTGRDIRLARAVSGALAARGLRLAPGAASSDSRRPPAAIAASIRALAASCGTSTSMWIRLRCGRGASIC